MKKNLTEIVFILDRSGSMSGLEADTIGGFNSMIAKQKKQDGEALVSTVLFDNVSEVIHDRVNIRDIQPMTDKDYTVRGCTALLDAIGGAIHHIGNIHKYARPEDVPEHTLFIITTDGMENAALTGYDDAIHETGRLTDEKIDLSEEEKEALDRKQQILMERLGDHPALTVAYFVPDAKKSGGAYVTKDGNLKKIDGFERWMMLTDGTKIPLDDVADIESELFRDLF